MDYDRVRENSRLSIHTCIIAIGSLLWLGAGLAAINAGVGRGLNIVHPLTQDAEAECTLLKTELFEARSSPEALLESCEGVLQSVSLPQRPRETHSECLARAISTGHHQFQHCLGLSDEDVPYRAESAITWSEGNCARHFFVPQTQVNSQRYNFCCSLDTLGLKALRALKAVRDAAVNCVVQAAQWLKSKALAANTVDSVDSLKGTDLEVVRHIEALVDAMQQRQAAWAEKVAQEASHLQLPPGYTMNCSAGYMCRLASTSIVPPIPVPGLHTSLLAENVDIAVEHFRRLQVFSKRLQIIHDVVSGIKFWMLDFLLLVLLFTLLVLNVFTSGHSKKEFRTLPDHASIMDATHACSITIVLYAFAEVSRYEPFRSADLVWLRAFKAIFLFIGGSSVLIHFLIPDRGSKESFALNSLLFRLKKIIGLWSIKDILSLLKLNCRIIIGGFRFLFEEFLHYTDSSRTKSWNTQSSTKLEISAPIITTPTAETPALPECESNVSTTKRSQSLYEDIQEMRRRIHAEEQLSSMQQIDTPIVDVDLDTSSSDEDEIRSDSGDEGSLYSDSLRDQTSGGAWAMLDRPYVVSDESSDSE